ncbi:MAG: CpaF family protein [Candidatus Omnitrophica bacterium]|nr:CpaF family protein [Candidatus Omnitrophota bacterium]
MVKALKTKVRDKVIVEYGRLFSAQDISAEEFKEAVAQTLNTIVYHEHIDLRALDKERIISELLNDFLGFGPLDSVMKDPRVSEIMVNGPKKIFIERNGKTLLSDITFEDEKQLMYLIHKLLAPTRRRVDESYPYTDISLKDGSRVNIIIPPIALDGPMVTIRKFLDTLKSVEDLITIGTFDKRMADFLVACIKAKINIIFSGSTGAGKTTTLGVLSSYISDDERIITIEDTAELHLNKPNVVRLETRIQNIEGKGEISIRELFKNSLRMRPERIILGEIRSSEALDMLQAICSGHTGSLAVLHANTPQEVIYCLETMILTSGIPIGLEAIHRQMTAAMDIIVQQEQLLDGSRKVTYVTQVNGMTNGQINLEDIFVYDLEGISPDGAVSGRWKATGAVPKFYKRFENAGIKLPKDIFNKD